MLVLVQVMLLEMVGVLLLAVLAGISVCLAGMAWLVPAVLLLALWRLRLEGWLGAPRQRLVLDVQGQL